MQELYIVHRYDGHVFELTLKELFVHFSAYQIQEKFGYGTDFGKCISNYKYHKFTFSDPRSNLKVYYEYLYFITTVKGKLVHPLQVINEYFQKYDPNNFWYTCTYRRRISTGYKRKNGHCFRRIKTTAERRACCAVLKEEGEPEFRGRRRNLPSNWDDFMVSNSRSWKKQSKRKKQYKGS